MDALAPRHPHRLNDAQLRFALLNDWQRNFPLQARPFDSIGARYGVTGEDVIRALERLHREGAISRLGGAFNVGAGGAGLLCAMEVPPADLPRVAARVSSEPAVNHNYERLHRLNLWFVVTAGSPAQAIAVADRIASDTGLAVLRLPMRRAFHIDLGFDLRNRSAPARAFVRAPQAIPASLRLLAAHLEQGLPLVAQPFEALGQRCGMLEGDVLRVLEGWVRDGTLRRFGVIVRHHELGWRHNAMTVFQVPAARAGACGARLAAFRGVTLCYEREPVPGWPYNVYAMVHGQSRAEVETRVAAATHEASLDDVPREILFSNRRFKQTGSRYFAEALA